MQDCACIVVQCIGWTCPHECGRKAVYILATGLDTASVPCHLLSGCIQQRAWVQRASHPYLAAHGHQLREEQVLTVLVLLHTCGSRFVSKTHTDIKQPCSVTSLSVCVACSLIFSLPVHLCMHAFPVPAVSNGRPHSIATVVESLTRAKHKATSLWKGHTISYIPLRQGRPFHHQSHT